MDGNGRATKGKGGTLLSLSLGALLAASLTAGCAVRDPARVAESDSAVGDPEQARVGLLLGKSDAALARGRNEAAVRYAERAAALAPADARVRSVLGHAYLRAGRFVSATQACSDALSLDVRDGRAALDLALAQTALGDWVAARTTLAAYAGILAPADRGLALALAGDPAGGAVLIGEQARGVSGTATARQNLALALALGGRWAEARAVAAVDLPSNEVDARMERWARFVRPTTSSEQVATLLAIRPVADSGQPAALALVRSVDAPALAATVVPPSAPAETASTEVAAAPVAVAGGVRFAPLQEIVQPIAVAATPTVARPVPPFRVAASRAAAAPARGSYYVQLGAYDNAAVAQSSWRAAARRHAALGGLVPASSEVRSGGDRFYRLSVGGFARGDALALCKRLRAGGGRCFVRVQAGDATASWVRGDPKA